MDVGARLDQGGEAALGDLAAAEDDDPAAGEAEAYGVGGVFGHAGRLLLRRAVALTCANLNGAGVLAGPVSGGWARGAG
ncbi:hypothetical protein STENM223S_02646 [Streptomyces tendae]